VVDKGFLSVLRHVRSMVNAARCPDLSDQELLARFLTSRDEAAFTALVERHGPMVLAVCRRVLHQHQDAEDACQATFLVLARSASSIRKHTSLGSWLHGVAYRLSRKLKDSSMRRRRREAQASATAAAAPESEASWREVQAVLDDELSRLPEKFRAPLVACYLEGQARQEVAQQLGLPLNTLRGRLSQARERLRQRLARRGVTLSAALLVPALAEGESAAEAAMPATLVVVTTRSAAAFAAGQAAGAGVQATRPVALAEGWLQTVIATKFKLAAAVLVALTVLAAGVGLAAWPDPPPISQPPVPDRAGPAVDAAPGAQGKGRIDRYGDPLPAGSVLRLGTSRYRHGTVIDKLSVSADGKIAIVSSGMHIHGTVRVYDLLTGLLRPTFGNLSKNVNEGVAISPDGRILATKYNDWFIHLYEEATGKELRKLPLPSANPYTSSNLLAFAPDGKTLAATSRGETIHLLDVDTGMMRSLVHNQTLFAYAFSPDSSLIAGGGYELPKGNKAGYFVRLWDVASGKELRQFAHGSSGIRALAFSPDGKTLAGGDDDARLRLWDVDTAKQQRIFPPDGYRVRSVAFTPDGQTVAAAGDSIRFYDVGSGKERLRIERQAKALSFSADGKVLTGAVMGTIYRWDAATGKALTPEAGDSPVDHLLVSGDGRLIVTGGQDGDAHIWDARTCDHLKRLRAAWQRGIALSPDGRFLVWPAEDPTVKFKDPASGGIASGSRLRLYDIAADQFIERFPGFKGEAHDLTFSPDGKTLVTIDHRDGAVRMWEVASAKEQRSFYAVGEGRAAYSMWRSRLSPDGKTLAVAYHRVDNTRALFGPFSVRLWDMATGNELHELHGHFEYVEGLAFSPDSRFLVSGGQALQPFAQQQLNQPVNQVFVWDVAKGKRVPSLPDGLPDGAACIAYAPDGRTVATAAQDGTIKVWEVATWKVRAEFHGHRDRVNSLTFAPDGRLLSGGLDTTVVVWDVRPK
jgi:RNA polymerase sigma factor (sigma-70 family)